MKITRHYKPGQDYIVLKVECPPLPDKNITIYLDALMSGHVDIEQEIQKAGEDAERRLEKHRLAESLINGMGNG